MRNNEAAEPMKIREIEAIPFRVPLLKPVKFAVGRLDHLEHVLVRVLTDDGRTGVAEAPARHMIYGETQQSIVGAIRGHLAPAIIGMDVFEREAIAAALDRLPWNDCAKSAIDTATTDLVAQHCGVPLYRLLGGYRSSIEVCHILGMGPPDEVAAEAVEMHGRHGLTWFKIKGGVDPAADTARIAAVRKALGSPVKLTVDCNQGYSAIVAERLLPRWDEFDLAWIEEPCPGADFRGRARVAAACRTPFMIDESAFRLTDLVREAELGSCRIFGLKLARTGITTSRKVMALAEAHGIQVVVGSQAEAELGAMTSAHFAAAHRMTSSSSAELSFFLDAADRITEESISIVDGKIHLSSEPGLGIKVDEDRLARLRLD